MFQFQAIRKIISTLKKLTEETKVFVMVGNRDFLLSHQFEVETSCKLIKEPYILEHNTKNFLSYSWR